MYMIQKRQTESFEPLFRQVEDKYPDGIIFGRTDSRGNPYFFMMFRGKKHRRKNREELESLRRELIRQEQERIQFKM